MRRRHYWLHVFGTPVVESTEGKREIQGAGPIPTGARLAQGIGRGRDSAARAPLCAATAVIVATLLFVTSLAETFLLGHSASVTDAVMALAIALIFG